MERMRKIPKEIGLDRVFTPGRLRHQWLAAAYERLVPIRRVAVDQEPPGDRQQVQEEYRWAR
jgi:hypothetical protein